MALRKVDHTITKCGTAYGSGFDWEVYEADDETAGARIAHGHEATRSACLVAITDLYYAHKAEWDGPKGYGPFDS